MPGRKCRRARKLASPHYTADQAAPAATPRQFNASRERVRDWWYMMVAEAAAAAAENGKGERFGGGLRNGE